MGKISKGEFGFEAEHVAVVAAVGGLVAFLEHEEIDIEVFLSMDKFL